MYIFRYRKCEKDIFVRLMNKFSSPGTGGGARDSVCRISESVAGFTAAKRPSANCVQTASSLTSLVAQLENSWKLRFHSWMDETALLEIPVVSPVCLVLEFAVLAEQICRAKMAFAELVTATFAGWIECKKFATANSENWIVSTRISQAPQGISNSCPLNIDNTGMLLIPLQRPG